MSEIKVGDLVMLVGGCALNKLGQVGTVTEISTGLWRCVGCKKHSGNFLTARVPEISSVPFNPLQGWLPLSWLRKIEPLSEPEANETREEIEA